MKSWLFLNERTNEWTKKGTNQERNEPTNERANKQTNKRANEPTNEPRTNEPKNMISPGLEPGTFRVLGERDNHYTTESLDLWCEENMKTVFWCLEITLTGLYSLLFSR